MTTEFAHTDRRAVSCVLVGLFLLAGAGQGYGEPELITLAAQAPVQRTVELDEGWHVGGDDDEGILVGLIQDAFADDVGQVYLLDRQLAQVLVIAPDGGLVKTLGRQGEGPGELNRPHGLLALDDGRVGVVQGFPGRVTIINPDDTPAGEITVGGEAVEGGFHFLREMRRCEDHLVGVRGRATFDMESGTSRSISTLSIMDLAGQDLVEIVQHENENELGRRVFDEAGEFSELAEWALAPNGLLYTTPVRDAYQINVRNLEGQVIRTYRRDFTARKRNQKDKDRLTEDMIIVMNGRRMDIESKPLDHDPPIMGLNAAADGRLFVTNCYDQNQVLSPGCGASYDVISPTGAFVEELILMVPGFDPDNDRLLFLDGIRFLHVRNAESAARAMMAGFGSEEEEADPEDAEPLEVVLYTMP